MWLKVKDPVRLNRRELNEAARSLRVLLIFPPSRRAVRAMYTIHNETENSSIGAKPPLGPLYTATFLRAQSPHEVRVLDCQVLNLSDEEIQTEIRAFGPHVVGVSAWTDFWYDAWQCIRIAKEVDPQIHVTVGGPHVGIYPEVVLEHSGCDSVIVGDGELPLLWLVNSLSHGNVARDLPGLHVKGVGVKSGEDRFYIHGDLDSLPIPDRTLLPYRLYMDVIGKGDFVTTMITSRGCPYRCTFCKLSFQKTLSRSAASVVAEMEAIAALGIREIQVYDDTFTWSKQRLIDVCRGVVERGLKLRWAIRDRVSSATPESLEWLARAGCTRIHFGIESGSNKTLKRIKKAITVEQAVEAVRLAKRHGMEVLGYFMIGLPGESVDDMRETVRLARKLDLDYATFSVTVPYPGTEMYEEGLRNGVIREDYWLGYAIRPTPDFVLPAFWEEHLGKAELLRMRDEATRAFYFRPKYIVRELAKVRSPGEFWRKSRMALNLFQTAFLHQGEAVYLERSAAEMGAGLGAVGSYANNSANPHSVRS